MIKDALEADLLSLKSIEPNTRALKIANFAFFCNFA